MKIRHTWKLAILLSIAVCSTTWGQEPDQLLALKAEVQTAAWAQSWWMPRHEEKLAQLKTQEQIDLLMIGDSITHSWENGGSKVWDEYYAKRNPLNLGFSGDRTENVLWRLRNGAVEGLSPKLAVVMIGTNNTGHRQEKSEHTAAGVKEIVRELRTRMPEMKILLLAIFPRGAGSDDTLRKLNDGANEILAGYADGKDVFYLDVSGEFLDDDGTLPKSIMPDLLHPNGEGYEIWAKAMEPMLAKLMGE